jgi:hypothetical protein
MLFALLVGRRLTSANAESLHSAMLMPGLDNGPTNNAAFAESGAEISAVQVYLRQCVVIPAHVHMYGCYGKVLRRVRYRERFTTYSGP